MDYTYFIPLGIVLAVVIVYVGWQTYQLIKMDLDFTSMVVDYDDVFENIPDDPDNVLMTIPPEVCKAAKIKPGDTVSVEKVGNSLVIKKVK